MNRQQLFVFAAGLSVAGTAAGSSQDPFAVLWYGQAGVIDENERGYDVAIGPGGNAYYTGLIPGVRDLPNTSETDYFLTKRSPSGAVQWSRTLGSEGYEEGKSVSTDLLGNLFVAGTTTDGVQSQGTQYENAFLTKFDSAGAVLWSRQIDSGTRDYGEGVAVDAQGNAYLTGYTGGDLDGPNPGNWGAFLTKFDPAGNTQWTRHIGTPAADLGFDVAVDAHGNAYVTGRTQGDLMGPTNGGNDMFLTKVDTQGVIQWSTQVGTDANDVSFGVTVDDAGNAYLAGYTQGDLAQPNAGSFDAVAVKIDSLGVVQWSTQVGVGGSDLYQSVVVDDAGNVFLTGSVAGTLGPTKIGGGDALVTKLDPDGNVVWNRQFGSVFSDNAHGIAIDDLGHLYVAGETNAPSEGSPQGRFDAMFAKLVVPGDTDGDGDIDDADLGTLFANYTGPILFQIGPKTGAEGDANGDGDVDDADLGTAFSGYTGPIGNAPVPEPNVIALLGVAGLLVTRRGRR